MFQWLPTLLASRFVASYWLVPKGCQDYLRALPKPLSPACRHVVLTIFSCCSDTDTAYPLLVIVWVLHHIVLLGNLTYSIPNQFMRCFWWPSPFEGT